MTKSEAMGETLAISICGRMERLGLRAWAGEPGDVGRALGTLDNESLAAHALDPEFHDQMAALGWDAEFTGKGRRQMVCISRLEDPADHQTDWYLKHVHPQPGAVASLADVRTSWYDYCVSRRIKLTKPQKEGITKTLDAAGFKRTRWTIDGVNVTGYKDVAVTFDPGSDYRPPTQARAVDSDPISDDEVMRAMRALDGMAAPIELEKAYADLTGTPMRLCRMCGKLTIRDQHRQCGKRTNA